MATEVKRRRGTTIEHSTFTGAVAELTVDLTKDTVVVHDGATQGGFPLLREDFSNVPTTAPFTNISLDTAIFDTTYSADGNEAQGTLYWNEDEQTLSLVTNGQTTELGQKVEVHVKNQTGAQINKGEVVYASGTVGSSGRITVAKMIADGTIAAKRVVGVAAENIADGADGKVVHFGKIRKVNTNSFNEGDILWVSTATAGAFQNTEPVQADGDLALPIAFVVTKSVNNGELFVRINAIDENEYQDYDAGLQDISGLTPSDDTIIVGDGTNWVAESGDTARASLGLTIGTHVQAWDAQLDTLSGLSADQATAIVAVTASEYQQLQNIDTVTISNTQWGYLGELDQSLTQASSPTFAGLTVDGLVIEDEVRTLQSDVIENHLEIESLQDNKVEVGFLFPDGDGQALGTGDNATFNTVTLGEQADSANEAVRADRTVSAGNGLTGGGALTGDVTISMDTPSTLTVSTSNAVTTGSHTHALDLSGRSITLSDDSDAVITFDTNTQDLGADRTYTPTIADHASGQRGVLSIGAQDIYGSKTFINNLVADANVGTSDFVSQTTGWNVTSSGAADFRSLYSDEIRTEAFVAEISEALVGADFLTKSRGVLSRNFTIPSNGNTGTLYVEDLEGFEGTQVFSDNDWLRLRVIDKSGGGLVVVDVWGQVTSYTDLSGGEQSWTFTTDDDGGSSGSVIYAGSVALDYGQSGDGFIVRTTLDSQGSPYSQVVRWTNTVSGSPDPNDADTTYTVLTRTGELGGIASLSGAGLYAKDRVYFDFGDADIFQIGKDVGGAGSHGVRIDNNNYWYGTGDFKVSNGTQFLELSSGDLTGTFGNITFSSDEFTLTAGNMTIDETEGISLDANNYWNQDGTFKVSNGTQFLELSDGDLTGTFGNIDFESDSFTLDAGTIYLESSGTPVMALDTSDASTATIDTGTGFYADGAGNLRIGDSSTYLKFDTTDGLQIKIGDDDLSTAIADIRSDLIDIYLSDQSTFSGIQFLSGQLVLKAGTGNSIASITLDGTQEDVSTISLDADYIVVTGTTIFKSAKDGSTTPTTLGDATFIDGGTIVTNSITATEIAANTITASEIAAGTITATEIDVADLFAENADITGTLTIASGGSLTSSAVTFNDTSFSLDVSDLEISSSNALIKIGHDTTSYSVKIGLTDISNAPNHGGKYGLEIDSNNYWKAVKGFDTNPDSIEFKVGDASNFISFDTSSNTLDITTDTFDLDATTLVIDSGTNSGKIALGATPPTAYNSGTGIYFDGTGKALIGAASGNKIQFDGTDIIINADTFDLATTNLSIDSANEIITIGSADSVSLGKKLNLSASSDIDYRDSLDKYASTVDFFGLYLNPENYFGFVQDNEDPGISDGYNFRVGGETSNYIEVNGATGDVDINFDSFTLDATDAFGGIKIDSANELIQLEDANRVRTQVDVNNGTFSLTETVKYNADDETLILQSTPYETGSIQITKGDSFYIDIEAELITFGTLGDGDEAYITVEVYGGTTSGSQTNLMTSYIADLLDTVGQRNIVRFSAYSYSYEYINVKITVNSNDGDLNGQFRLKENVVVKSYNSQTRVSLDGVYVNSSDNQYARLTRSANELVGILKLGGLPTKKPQTTGIVYNDNGTLKIS